MPMNTKIVMLCGYIFKNMLLNFRFLNIDRSPTVVALLKKQLKTALKGVFCVHYIVPLIKTILKPKMLPYTPIIA